MIGVEWISFEIGALVVGSIDSIQLALNAITMQLITIVYGVSIGYYYACIIMMFQVSLGIATAVSVRVGNELGAGQPQRAKRSALVSIVMTCEFVCAVFHDNTLILVVCIQSVLLY